MKVLRVIPSMKPEYGGPSQGVRNSIPEMNKYGIINEVVCLDDPNEAFERKDIFKIIPIGRSKGPWAFNSRLSKWLEDNLNSYDVVIVHGIWSYHTFAVRSVLAKLRRRNLSKIPKLYIMPHGMLDPYFQHAPDRKLKSLRNLLYWKFIESRNIASADGILFTCDQELLLARKTFKKYDPKKEINVSYGIKSPPQSSEARGESDSALSFNGKYFLFLSRLDKKKGVDVLIHAYLRILENNLDVPDLIIAGPGQETVFGQKLLQLAGGNKKIHFPGMLIGNNKWMALYNCEVFILPSHQENFGIAVVEALACKKPVLISNQVNIFKEIIKGNGGFAETDTIEGTVRLMQNWMSLTDKEKNIIGQNAYEVYKKNFTVEEAVRKMVKVLGH